MTEAKLILVQATVNLNGLRAGEYAWVDPNDPWMRDALKNTWIVRAEPPASYDEPAASSGSLAADGGQVHEDAAGWGDRP